VCKDCGEGCMNSENILVEEEEENEGFYEIPYIGF